MCAYQAPELNVNTIHLKHMLLKSKLKVVLLIQPPYFIILHAFTWLWLKYLYEINVMIYNNTRVHLRNIPWLTSHNKCHFFCNFPVVTEFLTLSCIILHLIWTFIRDLLKFLHFYQNVFTIHNFTLIMGSWCLYIIQINSFYFP